MGIVSQETIAIINATAPVVAANATKITSTFYPKILNKHPELYKYFNESNQRSMNGGNKDSAQSKTLADAVVAYAINIEKLDNLGSAVTRIVQKHCALGIQPAHYVVVHDNLMESIGEVLGDAVTAEIAGAWSAAVMALAKILMGLEASEYEKASKTQWSGPKDFTISEIIDETSLIKSFRMKASDGKGTCPFIPGQYISVYESPEGKEFFSPRHYTITSHPDDDYYQISIKLLSDDNNHNGVMSTYLHSKKVGDTIKLGPVFGPDLLGSGDNSRAAAFVSVGVGITPTLSMLSAAKQTRPKVAVFHGDTNSSSMAFKDQLIDACKDDNALISTSFSKPEEADQDAQHYSSGRLSADKIVSSLEEAGIDSKEGTDYYVCCGPNATTPIVKGLWNLGVKKENIHMEFFGPFSSVE